MVLALPYLNLTVLLGLVHLEALRTPAHREGRWGETGDLLMTRTTMSGGWRLFSTLLLTISIPAGAQSFVQSTVEVRENAAARIAVDRSDGGQANAAFETGPRGTAQGGTGFARATASAQTTTATSRSHGSISSAVSRVIVRPSHDVTATLNFWAERSVSVSDTVAESVRSTQVDFSRTPDPFFRPFLFIYAGAEFFFTLNDLTTGATALSTYLATGVGAALVTAGQTEETETFAYQYDGFEDKSSDPAGHQIRRGARALSRAENVSLSAQLIAGREYEIGIEAHCVAQVFAVEQFVGSTAGASSVCDAGRSAYWNGLTDIVGLDGGAVQDFKLLTSAGDGPVTDFTFASALSPAPANPAPAGVPEPATWALMLIGFGAAGAATRRHQRLRYA